MREVRKVKNFRKVVPVKKERDHGVNSEDVFIDELNQIELTTPSQIPYLIR